MLTLGERAEVVGEWVEQDKERQQGQAQADQAAAGEAAGALAGQRRGRQQPAEQEQRAQAEQAAQEGGEGQQEGREGGGGAFLVVPVDVQDVGGGGVQDDHPGDHRDPKVVHPTRPRCGR